MFTPWQLRNVKNWRSEKGLFLRYGKTFRCCSFTGDSVINIYNKEVGKMSRRGFYSIDQISVLHDCWPKDTINVWKVIML